MSAAVAEKLPELHRPATARQIATDARFTFWLEERAELGRLLLECIGTDEMHDRERRGASYHALSIVGAPAFTSRTALAVLSFIAGQVVNGRRLGVTGGYQRLADYFRRSGYLFVSPRSLEAAIDELVGCRLVVRLPMFEGAAERRRKKQDPLFMCRDGRLVEYRESAALLCPSPELLALVEKCLGVRRRRSFAPFASLASQRLRTLRDHLPSLEGREMHRTPDPETEPCGHVDNFAAASSPSEPEIGAVASPPTEVPPAAGRLEGASVDELAARRGHRREEGYEVKGSAVDNAGGGATAPTPSKTPPAPTGDERRWSACANATTERAELQRLAYDLVPADPPPIWLDDDPDVELLRVALLGELGWLS